MVVPMDQSQLLMVLETAHSHRQGWLKSKRHVKCKWRVNCQMLQIRPLYFHVIYNELDFCLLVTSFYPETNKELDLIGLCIPQKILQEPWGVSTWLWWKCAQGLQVSLLFNQTKLHNSPRALVEGNKFNIADGLGPVAINLYKPEDQWIWDSGSSLENR